MSEAKMIIEGIVIVVGILAVAWISTGNSLVRKKIKVDEALSGIEVALNKRFDVLTKMLDVTRGYAKHEKDVLETVIHLRKGMNVSELNEENRKLGQIHSRIAALAEAYPELHSDTVFVELQKSIREVEEHLQAARRLYNANVSGYNQAIAVFPSSIVAKSKNLTEKEFFEAEEGKREDVKIEF